ncbi:MAG: TetR/AcrR family transcriptional regulator [Steroidobacteraceae bacterium]
MPKISAAAAARRRAHILDAARQCFAEHGIHVSVDEICAKAAVSKGAFYGYFDSKDAAIEALAKDHERVIGTVVELDSVERLIEKLTQLTTGRSTASSRLELETWVHALRLPSLRAALHDNVDGLRQALAASITRISRSAVLEQRTSPSSVAEILTIFSMGLIASAALGAEGGSRSAEAALKALVTALVSGKRYRGRRARV